MTLDYIDITRRLGPDTPVWPGSPGLATSAHMALARGDVANATRLVMDVHTGTHVDAPRHFVAGGAQLEDLGLDPFVGAAYVAAAADCDALDAAALEALEIPTDARRVLLKTRNSLDTRFGVAPFRDDYVALTLDGARWVADRGLLLIGIDYLSIQRFHDPPDTHQILLETGVAILEGLDLADVEPGRYTLICLPLRLLDVEAAPARAILLRQEPA